MSKGREISLIVVVFVGIRRQKSSNVSFASQGIRRQKSSNESFVFLGRKNSFRFLFNNSNLIILNNSY